MTVLLRPEQRWACPNCTVTDLTSEARIHTRFHACAGLKGMTAPLVRAGTDCKVEAVERDDYVGSDLARYDGDGTPIMSVVTTYADGRNDTAVMAATATKAST